MPDPDMLTISATEVPALYGASPYVTKWMLYQKFANGLDISEPADTRMSWGTLMQSIILSEVAHQKKLQVYPNDGGRYSRRGRLGCTRDAVIVCPDRGPGALEIKCVFDYQQWMTKWRGGDSVPRHYELQLQTQMFVGEESHIWCGSYQWGMIAVWCCADLYFFERKPIGDFVRRLPGDAEMFFKMVEHHQEPDPFGAPVEMPLLASLYPTRADSVLDMSEDTPENNKIAEDLSMYDTQKDIATGSKRVADALRIKLIAIAKDAAVVRLPHGVNYRVKKSGSGRTVEAYIPEKEQ